MILPHMHSFCYVLLLFRPYSRFEDEKIVRYLIDSRRHSEVNGNTVWKLMETKKVIKGRSWQSIKERFRKKIRVSLADWANFTDAEKALFGLDKN